MNEVYCPLPFRHAYIDATGIGPCCQIRMDHHDLHTWVDNAELKAMQQEILAGTVPKACEVCHKQERQFGNSLRTDSGIDYNFEEFTDTVIDFIDYRSNNLCNFKCRSCNPVFSHGIANEALNNPVMVKAFGPIENRVVSIADSATDWIISNVAQLNRLMFTGGEPTIMPETRRIIKEVVAKNPEISILITTNGSFTDDFWYELVDKIPRLHWTISIDAVGPAAEIVRHGTRWEQVEKNLRWLADNANSVNINTVVTNINLFHLRPVLELVLELQHRAARPNGLRHQFFVSRRPYMLAADNLTGELLAKATAYLEGFKDLPLQEEPHEMLVNLMRQIEQAEPDEKLWAEFKEYSLELDRLRGQDHTKLFP